MIGGDGALTGHHIGGEYNYDVVSADITITGGTIELDGLDGNSSVGARYGAAIGGGNPGGIAKNITITGGEITVSSMYGAGIGGGQKGSAKKTPSPGGTVTASAHEARPSAAARRRRKEHHHHRRHGDRHDIYTELRPP